MTNDRIYNFIPLPRSEEVIYLETESENKSNLGKHNYLKLSKFNSDDLISGQIKYNIKTFNSIYLDKSWESLNVLSGLEIKSIIRKNLEILSYSKLQNLEWKYGNEDFKIAIEKILKSFKNQDRKDMVESIFGFADGKFGYKGKLKFNSIDLSNANSKIKWLKVEEKDLNSEKKELNSENYFDLKLNRIKGSKFYQLAELDNSSDNSLLHGKIEFENLSKIELGLLIMSIKPFKDGMEYIGLESKAKDEVGQICLDISEIYIEEFEVLAERLNRFKNLMNSSQPYVPKRTYYKLPSNEIEKLKLDFEMLMNEKLGESNTAHSVKLFDYENYRMNAFYYSKTRQSKGKNIQSNESVETIMKEEIEAYKHLQKLLVTATSKVESENVFLNSDEEIKENYSLLLISETGEEQNVKDIMYEFKNIEIITLDEVYSELYNDLSNYDLAIFNNYSDAKEHLKLKDIMDKNIKMGFVFFNDKRVQFRLSTENKAFNFASSIITLPGAVMSVAKYIDAYRKKESENND